MSGRKADFKFFPILKLDKQAETSLLLQQPLPVFLALILESFKRSLRAIMIAPANL